MKRSSRRRGRLSEEDRAIWEKVVESLTPLQAGGKTVRFSAAEKAPAERPAAETPAEPKPRQRRQRYAGGAVPAAQQAPHPRPVGRPEPGLDRRTAERLRRGAREPDARIDLHGLTADRAHARLDAFVGQATAQGHRCLLVITGKGGRRPPDGDAPFMAPDRGVLRDAAPHWLRTGRHAGRIVGIYEAHRRHGGAGAFYVYLRKPR